MCDWAPYLWHFSEVIQTLTPSVAFFESVRAACERSKDATGKALDKPIEVGAAAVWQWRLWLII